MVLGIIINYNNVLGIFAEKYLKDRLGDSIDMLLIDQSSDNKNRRNDEVNVYLGGYCCKKNFKRLSVIFFHIILILYD